MTIYSVETLYKDNSINIIEFHRYDNNTCDMKIIKDYKMYFFCDEKAPIENFDSVIKTEPGYMSIIKTPLKKVYVAQPNIIKKLMGAIEDMGYKHYEADIQFHNRYTIDLKEEIPEVPLKVCWIDIETAPEDTFIEGKALSEQKFPDIATADQAICCLCTKIGDDMQVWLCGPNDYPNTRYFPKEEDMLNDFLDYFFKESPDIISAWNLDNFDLPYIINRCERLGVDISRLSKIRNVWYRNMFNKTYYKTPGTIQLDLLEGYKLWRKYGNMPLLESYSLDFVAETVLKKNKIHHGRTMAQLWKDDVKTLIEYNMWDVELLDLIDKQCKVIEFFDNIRRKCHIQFNDVYQTTHIIDGYLINRLKQSIILPTAKHIKGDKFGGAFVFPPIPGLYELILCLDIASMYPSIIKNFNISYETIGGTDIKLPLESGISFSKTPGIIPMFMDELAIERKGYKKKRNQYEKTDPKWRLYDQRQYGTKIIMNCFSHDTNIMTINGQKNVKDIKVGEYVYSINPKTHDLEKKKVLKTFKYDYTGNMIHINNQNIDLMVTPEHNMLVNGGKFKYAKDFTHNDIIPLHNPEGVYNEDYYINLLYYDNPEKYRFFVKKNIDLRKMKNMFPNIRFKKHTKQWCEVFCEDDLKILYFKGYEVFTKPKRNRQCNKFKPYISAKVFAKIIGFYVSEGSLFKTIPNGVRGTTYSINISQYKNINPATYKLIKDTIIELGIKPRCYDKSISFSSDIWYKILKTTGTTSKTKTIGNFISLPTKDLFQSLYLGDGNKTLNRYNTNSYKLATEVKFLLFKLGYRSIITQTKDGCYRVNFQKRNWKPHDHSINTIKNNSDKVYCVEVEDNHTVYAGRNNKMCWTGQSFFGYLGFPGSRLYKKEVAEAITSMGQHIIKIIAKWCKERGNKVIYGDTDSVHVTSLKTNPIDAILDGVAVTKYVNEQLERFAKDISGKNYLFIEFEKALKKVLFTNAKKRYAYQLLWEAEKQFNVDTKIHISGFDNKRCISGSTQLILKKNNIINISNASDLEKCDLTHTQIMTENGFKPIKNVFINNVEKIYRMTLSNGSIINCSDNHKFLVMDNNVIVEKQLKNIKLTDKIPMSFNQINGNLGNYNMGRFLGLFLAEGSFTPHGITFSFNLNEHEYINFIENYSKNVLGINPSTSVYKDKTLTNVMIYGDGVKEYVKQFVKGISCDTKHLSSKYPSFSYDCKIGIITGMMEGDGHIPTNTYTTTSKKLIKDLCNLCSMTNKPYSVYKKIKTPHKPLYRMRILKCVNGKYKRHFKTYKNNMWWLSIKNIENNKDAIRRKLIKMYDIEVDSDTHLFKIANGIVTHNSDSNFISKTTQLEVIKMILDNQSKQKVMDLIRQTYKDMKNGKYKDIDIGTPKGITKELHEYYPPPAIVKGAYYSNEHFGTNFGKNSKPKFTYIKNYLGHTPRFKMPCTQNGQVIEKEYELECIAFDKTIPDGFVLDWERISDLTLKKKLINIFEAVGWEWEPLEQQSLNNWL
jgi:DNA polymerase, archaea type